MACPVVDLKLAELASALSETLFLFPLTGSAGGSRGASLGLPIVVVVAGSSLPCCCCCCGGGPEKRGRSWALRASLFLPASVKVSRSLPEASPVGVAACPLEPCRVPFPSGELLPALGHLLPVGLGRKCEAGLTQGKWCSGFFFFTHPRKPAYTDGIVLA